MRCDEDIDAAECFDRASHGASTSASFLMSTGSQRASARPFISSAAVVNRARQLRCGTSVFAAMTIRAPSRAARSAIAFRCRGWRR